MQFLVHTEKDLAFLQGKFILQVSSNDPDMLITQPNWGFIKEKRLFMVVGLSFISLFGDVRAYENFEKFKNKFNHYLFDHMIAEGKTDGGRFHRLLTNREIDFLCSKMKEENF